MALVPLIVMSFDLPTQNDMMYLEGLSNSFGPRVRLNANKITNFKSMASSRLVYFQTGVKVDRTTGSAWNRLAGWLSNGTLVLLINPLSTLKIHVLINEPNSMLAHSKELYINVSFQNWPSYR